MKTKRTLYECAHARVETKGIYCEVGYSLSSESEHGSLDTEHLAKGHVLAPAACQKCAIFEAMGPPLSEEERGWLKGRPVAGRISNAREAVCQGG